MSSTTQRINGHAPIKEMSPRDIGTLARAAFNVEAYAIVIDPAAGSLSVREATLRVPGRDFSAPISPADGPPLRIAAPEAPHLLR